MITYSFKVLSADVISGVVLAGSIALSFIVMMSFGDFLRFNWNMELHNGGVGEGAAANRRAAARANNNFGNNPRANRLEAIRNRQNRRRQIGRGRGRGVGWGGRV